MIPTVVVDVVLDGLPWASSVVLDETLVTPTRASAFTPSSSADPAGSLGAVAYDSSFVYVKTSAGWRRAAVAAF